MHAVPSSKTKQPCIQQESAPFKRRHKRHPRHPPLQSRCHTQMQTYLARSYSVQSRLTCPASAIVAGEARSVADDLDRMGRFSGAAGLGGGVTEIKVYI